MHKNARIATCFCISHFENFVKICEICVYIYMNICRHLKAPRQSCCGFYFGKYSKGASHCPCHPLAPNFSKYGLALMVGLGHSCLSCPSEIPVEISQIFEAHSIPKSSINRYPLLSTRFKRYFYRYHWYISINIYMYIMYIYIIYIYIYTISYTVYTNITTIFSSGILWTQKNKRSGLVSKVPKARRPRCPMYANFPPVPSLGGGWWVRLNPERLKHVELMCM